MRNLIWKASASTLGILLALSVFTGPSASAQDDATECFEDVESTQVVLTESLQLVVTDLTPDDEYENRDIEELIPVLGTTEVTVVDQVSVPCEPDEVLGIVTEPDEVLGLAITGSEIDAPLAIGISLIGAGGLLVAVANRRRNRTED